MTRDTIGFTLNIRVLANQLAQDPTTLAEMMQGIQDAANSPVKMTQFVGSANLTPGEGIDPTWASVFPATQESVQPGQPGLFYRNNTNGGKGDRIQMRIKKQTKTNQATQSAGQAALGNLSPQQAANILAQAGLMNQQPAVQPAPAAQPAALDLANISPEQAASILAQAGMGTSQQAADPAPAATQFGSDVPPDIQAIAAKFAG